MQSHSPNNIDHINEEINRHGYALCRRLPCISESWLLDFASRIGSLDLCIPGELSGPPVMHLMFNEAKAPQRDRPAYFSNEAFPLHSDLAYVFNPPRYLFTLCLQPDRNGGGLTILSDCTQAWQALSLEHKRQLEEPQFQFRNPPNTPPGGTGRLPVFLVADDWSMFRYRRDSMTYDSHAADAIASFSDALDECAFSVPLCSGDLLIVDNHRILHGRTAFLLKEIPNERRHLLRAYAQDKRRIAFFTRSGGTNIT